MIYSVASPNRCFYASCPKADYLQQRVRRCAQCHFATYCDSQCQSADWPRHQLECIKIDLLAKMEAILIEWDSRNQWGEGGEWPTSQETYDYYLEERAALRNRLSALTALLRRLDYLTTFPATRSWAMQQKKRALYLIDASNQSLALFNQEIKILKRSCSDGHQRNKSFP